MKTVPHIVEAKHLKLFIPKGGSTHKKRKTVPHKVEKKDLKLFLPKGALKKRGPKKGSLKKKSIKGPVMVKSHQSVSGHRRGNIKDTSLRRQGANIKDILS
jgi:hypothetical protein